MFTEMTDRQRDVFEFIVQCIQDKGYPPTVREICLAVGLRSPSTVHSHLASLEQKGFIRRDPSKGRAIEILASDYSAAPFSNGETVPVPLVGRVTAGAPILAVENIDEVVMLPRDMARSNEGDVFLLNVSGTSMIEAGILDNDRVLVRRQSTADNGDIVVALLDEDATVKRFFREGTHIRLQPENSAMEPILTRNAVILGKVIGLLRTY